MIERLPPIATDTCYLYLVRHASTVNNVAIPPRLQGRHLDAELSPQGRVEAEATARFLATVALDAVYTSPLLRARETAAAICQGRHIAPAVVDELIECDLGHWEGKSWGEVERDDPDAYQRFHEHPSANPYGDGENFTQVLARVAPALERLMQSHLGRAIAVVSHKVVNRVFLAHLIPCPLDQARDLSQFNAAVNLVRFRHGHARVVTINSVWHLDTWSE